MVGYEKYFLPYAVFFVFLHGERLIAGDNPRLRQYPLSEYQAAALGGFHKAWHHHRRFAVI